MTHGTLKVGAVEVTRPLSFLGEIILNDAVLFETLSLNRFAFRLESS